jgi:metallo-beta-lactamase family protein
VRAKTHTLSGYSAHADQLDLIKFVQGIPNPPKEIRLVHGEDHAKEVLQKKLQELGYNTVYFKDDRNDAPIRNSNP